MRLLFVDHQTLARLAESNPPKEGLSESDPIIEETRRALETLSEPYAQIVIMRCLETKTFDQIEIELGIDQERLRGMLNAAFLALRQRLLPAVRNRWPKGFAHLKGCPICAHGQRELIEQLILGKTKTQSWKSLNRRIKEEVGVIFNPPIIMKHHVKYHILR